MSDDNSSPESVSDPEANEDQPPPKEAKAPAGYDLPSDFYMYDNFVDWRLATPRFPCRRPLDMACRNANCRAAPVCKTNDLEHLCEYIYIYIHVFSLGPWLPMVS